MALSLAFVTRLMLVAWVLLEMSNRAGFSLFMGRAPCVCDERTVYVVQATNPSRDTRAARLRRALGIVLPGILLLVLVEVLLGAHASCVVL
jgi:hypothetical protein